MTQPKYTVPIGLAICQTCGVWACYGREDVQTSATRRFSFIRCHCGASVLVPPLKPESQPTP